jgi:hypothetical protein
LKPFYFHVFASGEFYTDDEGYTCSSLDSARLHAVRLIKLIVDLAPSAYAWRSWSVIVAAPDGAPVLAVPFAGHVGERGGADSDAQLQPRRGYPQVITYGDAGPFGAPANEHAAPPGLAAVAKGNAPVGLATCLPRATPGLFRRRPWLSRLLRRFNPHRPSGAKSGRFALRPRATAR